MNRLSSVQRQAMDYSRRLGQRVRVIRSVAGLTRKELADRSHVSERYLASLELGHANPSLEILFRLATALDMPIERLICVHATNQVRVCPVVSGEHRLHAAAG